MPAVALVEDPDQLIVGLTPLRRRLLNALGEPASATQLADRLGLPRQKVNYHLRVLERAGLIELAELRQRRGCTERVLRRSADAFVVDPDVLPAVVEPRRESVIQRADAHAADHLIASAGAMVRDVTRMKVAADANDQRLLTFTLESEIGFSQPADVHAFTDALAAAVAEVATRFHDPAGRSYRLVLGAHPAPNRKETQ